MTISQEAGRPARARFALKLLRIVLVAMAIVVVLLLALPGDPTMLLAQLFFYLLAPVGVLAVMVFAGWATFPQAGDQNPGLGLILVIAGGLLLTGLFLFALVGGVDMLLAGG